MEEAGVADGRRGPRAVAFGLDAQAEQGSPGAFWQLILGVPRKLAAMELRGPVSTRLRQPAGPRPRVGDEGSDKATRPVAGREGLGSAIRHRETAALRVQR